MKTTDRADTVYFSVKGQVVIPQWLRRELGIEKNTRAIVYQEDDHIVLKPITARHFRKLRGSLKGNGVLEALMEDRRSEGEL